MDGIDAALLRTDGRAQVTPGASLAVSYDEAFRKKIKTAVQAEEASDVLVEELTQHHIDAVEKLLSHAGITAKEVDVIGFHGHTLWHKPEIKKTLQIGDGKLLAEATGIDVVANMRENDMRHGGQGAPLVPLYHQAIAAGQQMAAGIVNIGGVCNMTWLNGDDIMAFDVGPGNVLIDEWMQAHLGEAFDRNGAHAARGKIDEIALSNLLTHPFFTKIPPKSLDRYDFSDAAVRDLSQEDALATLTAFTAQAIVFACGLMAVAPEKLWISGGGRHNQTLMEMLQARADAEVVPIDALGYDGDMIEAQAFAYLAVRALQNLPLTLPETTGVTQPVSGGDVYRVSGA